ncbi:gliding motility lipoprotein GldH [Flammeovirga sp. SubArs3]|uniref:gliding motility lipoprotein GldH n=1 Tax=Flammeovirga sp. SubArs3 TaxID=2995316 RepID=UPI00248C8744|nr:gliding motility lipoprotein GldH [Flammeovirga sp. SubArs3]
MTKLNHLFQLVCSLFVASLLFSCDANRVNEEYVDYNQEIWPVDSIASFQFDIEDKNQAYNLIAYVRNTENYPFQNIYLKYQLTSADSLAADTLIANKMSDFQLFEVKTGEPFGEVENSLGNSSTGAVYNHPLLLKKKMKFPEEGSYQLNISHYMRPDSLEGIMGIGYRIEIAE